MPTNVLISAGEASGDLYASEMVRALMGFCPRLRFYGCAGTRMQAMGVEPVVHASSLSVVGLLEVVTHLPRIYGEYRKLIDAVRRERPALAILTDSPDFNLRVARQLKRLGIPVVYLVAPQVWAWRERRVRQIRRDVDALLCIFPFEEEWFRARGVNATYVGHPLTRVVRATASREEFFLQHGLARGAPLVTALPGSRPGEVARHMPLLLDASERLARTHGARVIVATPPRLQPFFRERISPESIQVIEGDTWNAIAHADVCLAASGTVTVEAALLGVPMVTFYRVAALSWMLGRRFVRAPFLTMVNLIAGREIVPELMQEEATGERVAAEAGVLLTDAARRARMKRDLACVTSMLQTPEHPMERAARVALEFLP